MSEVLTPDICVIGVGPEALAAAATAAALKVSVVLVATRKMGGDGLNYGNVSSQFLVAAGNRVRASATAGVFGIEAAAAATFFRTRPHVRQVIAAIAANETVERFTGLGVRVLFGAPRFVNRATVEIDGDTVVRARRFVVATGSAPAIPAIAGLAETSHFTSETIFNIAEPPSHLAVIGGDAIGLELAQAFRRLGAQVTVIAGRLLANEDEECATVAVDALAAEGIAFRSGASVTSVRQADGRIELTLSSDHTQEIVAASHVLVAAGRAARLDGLDLDEGRIRYGPSGILVNRTLRTSNHRVYAIGDAAGGPMLQHVANDHAALVVRNALFRSPTKVRYNVVPRVIYTDPELAHVGLTDVEAKRRRYSIRVLRWPYRENDRAQATRQLRGHIKVVAGRGGRILGVTIVGAHAGELLAPWTLAMDQGLDIRAMAQVMAPYPTLGEISKRAATTYFSGGGVASSVAQPFIRWLRRRG